MLLYSQPQQNYFDVSTFSESNKLYSFAKGQKYPLHVHDWELCDKADTSKRKSSPPAACTTSATAYATKVYVSYTCRSMLTLTGEEGAELCALARQKCSIGLIALVPSRQAGEDISFLKAF
ncbi:hypothetical protein HII31_01002 [Pseudocercospora fuligena]|uniref:Uncharacterized protein n=1 Tax=Pseudocercospora fuligena TaxID=685502 RepID=A0A8H6RVI6_9PEZI|nr:hypothetical protein HII31_01002 [Pseudocercospora fuligena]